MTFAPRFSVPCFSPRGVVLLLLLGGGATAGCWRAPRQVAPVASAPAADASPHMPAMEMRADSSRHGYTAADAHFMQHMIAHHAQALAMTGLLVTRTARDDMRLLAERIDVSQKAEISMMQAWLRDRGETVPDVDAGPMHDGMAGHDMAMPGMAMPADSSHAMSMGGMAMSGMMMPGMLTPAQMDALTRASGPAFDRLFLSGMIQHHEGALVMVHDLFATQGAGQESQIFRFASDVDADQRAEIKRMRALLDAMPGDVQHR